MPNPPIAVCPTCGSTTLREHCPESNTCDWLTCKTCKSFGTGNGARWVDMKTKAA